MPTTTCVQNAKLLQAPLLLYLLPPPFSPPLPSPLPSLPSSLHHFFILVHSKIVEPVKKPEVEESPMDVAARSIEAMKKIAQLRKQVEEESDEEEEVRRGG